MEDISPLSLVQIFDKLILDDRDSHPLELQINVFEVMSAILLSE